MVGSQWSEPSPRFLGLRRKAICQSFQNDSELLIECCFDSFEEAQEFSGEALDMLHRLSMRPKTPAYANPRRIFFLGLPRSEEGESFAKLLLAADEKLFEARRALWNLEREHRLLRHRVAEAARRIKATRSDRMSGLVGGKLREVRLFLEQLTA